ncbi:hypothetical protein OHB05_30210 [Streptomyces sp. NBC_00638]|nr:hypothetical protein [Streptomyces sp. NBC_00568]MCX5006862.1 hypothetical protein [Streptomyces sp. NBC_00638]
MGVFARLLRRSKSTEEASPAEVETAVQPDGTEAEVAAEGSSDNEGEATAGTAGTDTAEDVDIPKQQTAEQAADNEAGEGART